MFGFFYSWGFFTRSLVNIPCPLLQIDIMVLYSPELAAARGEAQLRITIVAAFATSNQALVNSGINNLDFNLVRVDEVSWGLRSKASFVWFHRESCAW